MMTILHYQCDRLSGEQMRRTRTDDVAFDGVASNEKNCSTTLMKKIITRKLYYS